MGLGRRLLPGVLVLFWLPSAASAQTLVDGTKRIVAGRAILDSDVRIARELKLVSPAAQSDDDILTELENRILVIAAIDRVTSFAQPSVEEIAERRGLWERAVGSDPAARLADVHMSEAELLAWFRDDIRLEKYEKQRFGREADPAKARNDWIRGLRKQAGLK